MGNRALTDCAVEGCEEFWARLNKMKDICNNMSNVNLHETVNAFAVTENERQYRNVGRNLQKTVERVCYYRTLLPHDDII